MQKRTKKIVCVAVLACVVVVAFLVVLCSRNGEKSAPHETRPLFDVLDSANMMLVTPVGLGEHAKGRVISGRLYKNFVQLLRQADAEESLQDTFKTECAVGLHIKLFRDTLSVAELRIAEKIGRIGDDVGVWTPKKMRTIGMANTFLREQGINFRPCSDVSAELSDAPINALNDLILSADTAVGTPLYELVKDADRVVVGFTKIITRKSVSKKEDILDPKHNQNRVELDSSQLRELISLLREPKKESFAGMCLCLPRAKVTFYRDSSVIMTVDVFGHDFDSLEKHPMGADFNSTGIWNSAHPEKFKAFFERVNPSAAAGMQKMRRMPPAYIDGRKSAAP
ncbi:MAG: hypothetical protein IJ177_08230 [Fibrobacter sp.]|uniref:hypothetical protein n=1 Tax=Fibrobacter sp. TaxID=35828 RepID=UPI0025BF9426|nr:hypothetical protein [Fibrobacter sp.]MBQ9226158.1 hypothetical protein [Fibrobacter sp.]